MVILELLLLYFITALIGCGTSFWLLGKYYPKWVCGFIWSPVIGFIWLVLSGTLLVFCSYPVSVWCNSWLLFSLLLSVSFGYASRHTLCSATNDLYFPVYSPDSFQFFLYGGIFSLLALTLPFIVGGESFSILRGNGTDAFNYVAMANALDNVPYDFLMQASPQWLASKHPFYPLAQTLLNGTRWPVSMLLALFSRWLGLSPYQFEYNFSLYFFLLEYLITFLFALKLSLKPKISMLLSLAVCIGFWGQWLLDIRAQSQMSVMPLVMASTYLLVNLSKKSKLQYWKECVLFCILVSAISFLYMEIIPIIALAGLILLVWPKNRWHLVGYYILAVLIAFLFLLFHFDYWSSLLTKMLTQAVTHKNNWDQAYFEWLYLYPFSGIWGLSPFNQIIATCIGIILTLLSLAALKLMYQKKETISASSLLLAMIVAGGAAFFYLYFHQQFWAAGKALSYIYPFIMILPIWAICSICEKTSKFCKFWLCIQALMLIWLGLQVCLGGWHIYNAYKNQEYAHYMWFHGEHNQHIWQSDAIEKAAFVHCKTIHLKLSNEWVKEYWSFVFSQKTPLTNVSPSCELMDKTSPQYLATNGEVFLLKK